MTLLSYSSERSAKAAATRYRRSGYPKAEWRRSLLAVSEGWVVDLDPPSSIVELCRRIADNDDFCPTCGRKRRKR